MDDQVPEDVKRERIERLVERVQRHARRAATRRSSARVQEVLVEGTEPHRPTSLGRGRSRGNKTVMFAPPTRGAEGDARAGADRAPPRRRPCAARARARRRLAGARAAGRRDLRRHRVGQERRGPASWPSGWTARSSRPTRCSSTAACRCCTAQPTPADAGARAAPPGRHLAARPPTGASASTPRLAHAAIDDVRARARLAIVAGGTGLYLRAALADMALPPQPPAGAARAHRRQYDADRRRPTHAYLAEPIPARRRRASTATTAAASCGRWSCTQRGERCGRDDDQPVEGRRAASRPASSRSSGERDELHGAHRGAHRRHARRRRDRRGARAPALRACRRPRPRRASACARSATTSPARPRSQRPRAHGRAHAPVRAPAGDLDSSHPRHRAARACRRWRT